MNNSTSKLVGLVPSNGEDKKDSALTRGFIIASVIILVAQVPICTLGNLKVCVLLYKRKQLRKVPHVLLGNLSFIGALVGAVHLPCYLSGLVLVDLFHKTISQAFCIIKFAISVLFFNLQTLTLIAMAKDRYDAVLHPYRRHVNPTNIGKLLKGVWLTSGLLTVLIFPLSSQFPYSCTVYVPLRENPVLMYTMVIGNVFLFGTIISIFVTFVRIINKLRSSVFNAETNQRAEIRVTRLSYSLMLCFLLSWLPLILFNIISSAIGIDRSDAYGLARLLVTLSNTNYLTNPFLHMKILASATSRNPESGQTVQMAIPNATPKGSGETMCNRTAKSTNETQL